MPSTTWKTTITVNINENDFRDMREWLDEHAAPVPSRNADVLSKFISATINSNAQWDGIYCRFMVRRATDRVYPWQQGYEDDRPRVVPGPVRQDSPLKQLALGSFGLLVMLALYLAFAG